MDSSAATATATSPALVATTAAANGSTAAGPAGTVVAPLHHSINYAKPFPDITKIEVFGGTNFKRWQERIFSILDMHGVGSVLSDPKPDPVDDIWVHANKVCRHTILSTLSNEIFDIYYSYKEAKEIWESLIGKYTAEDVGKQKFVVGNFYRWEMVEDKDIKIQINEYHKLIEDLKGDKIILQEEMNYK